MKALVVALLILMPTTFATYAPAQSASPPPECGSNWVETVVKAPATRSAPFVKINCNLHLAPDDRITKRLVIEGPTRGVTINCNEATIDNTGSPDGVPYTVEIRSNAKGERPENITIEHCNVIGSVDVISQMWRLQSVHYEHRLDLAQAKSREDNYVEWVRATAPTNIVLNDLSIAGKNWVPLYIMPGVTHVTLLNSVISGKSDSVGVYLDMESAFNTLKGNQIMVDSESREQLAIDGSERNVILNNVFKELDDGGIYLYRNCGEAAVVRRTTPSRNTIVNNIFFYRDYRGSNPAVWVGSRNGTGRFSDYCGKDRDYDRQHGIVPVGSSASDLSEATVNVVGQNLIYNRPWPGVIKIADDRSTWGNYVGENESIYINPDTRSPTRVSRLAGCYTVTVTRSGVSVFFAKNGAPNGSRTKICRDGTMIPKT